MGNPFSYSVSLRVKHPTLEASVIAAQLQMAPRFCWTAGEPRRTPKGAPLEGTRKESYCTFEIGAGDDGELTTCLNTALEHLIAKNEFLHEVRDTGGSLMFYVFWYPNGDTGAVFQPALLRMMADLGIGLGINVYDDRSWDS